MAKRAAEIFVQDIFECIEYLEQYTHGVSFADFELNIEKQDAIMRRIEIIGEATKNLPMKLRDNYPQIPWKQMAGLRDIVTHVYFGLRLQVVWNVATVEMPALKPEIQKIIEDLEK
ncbi:MAG: hypothetical protein EPGJADBJ_02853 [Saprospiraceae bacterium]|nr:hypothetical protein [Saprospiraceae bacterium]